MSEDQVDKKGEGFVLAEDPEIRVDARAHKMSKSRGNVINPDKIVKEYGADSLRLYEMFMGPLEAVKPWSMKGVEGVYRFLARAWRMIVDAAADDDPARRQSPGRRAHHRSKPSSSARTVAAVTDDIEAHAVQHGDQPPDGVHQRLHGAGRAAEVGDGDVHAAAGADGAPPGRGALADPRPRADPGLRALAGLRPARCSRMTRSRSRCRSTASSAVGSSSPPMRTARRSNGRRASDEKIAALLEGKTIRKAVVVPGKLVNFVVG